MLSLSRKYGEVLVEQFRLRQGLKPCGENPAIICCGVRLTFSFVSQIIITKSSDQTENDIKRRVIMHFYHLVCKVL